LRSILITGGAGFIGAAAAARFAIEGYSVLLFDDFSRPGSRSRANKLSSGSVEVAEGDIRDRQLVSKLIGSFRPSVVLHEAAQVAVTTSYANPRYDFEVNAGGTLNLLESVRTNYPQATIIVASTNKVYGELSQMSLEVSQGRYRFLNSVEGVKETQPIDFRTPYGCSKGAADLLAIEWSRSFDVQTIICRQSCIYGEGQFGVEDQGWIAWFTAAALLDLPLTVYGDGRQVRDVLHVDDLVDFYFRLVTSQETWQGEVFNIGGGPKHAVSVLEVIEKLGKLRGRGISFGFGPRRPGDQTCYVSDISKANSAVGWRPSVGVDSGIERLWSWMSQNRELVQSVIDSVGGDLEHSAAGGLR
jgi:CDP-paratose 2-epimerase